MLLDVVKVVATNDFKLILTLENGEVKEFNCKSIFHEKPFDTIADPFVFKQVKVSLGTVVWPN